MNSTPERLLGPTPNDIRGPEACFAYWGEHGDWETLLGQHRDSDILDCANFEAAKRELEKLSPEGEQWVIERSSHWAVGWSEAIRVEPGTPAYEKALELKADMEQYPVLDEDLMSMMEREEQEEWLEGELRGNVDHENWEEAKERYHSYIGETGLDDYDCDYDLVQRVIADFGDEAEEEY